MSDYRIPRYLDRPTQVLWWSLDEFIFGLGSFLLLFWLANACLAALIVPCVLIMLLRKIKGEQGITIYYQYLYWYFPPN